jgi:hypothetical protein
MAKHRLTPFGSIESDTIRMMKRYETLKRKILISFGERTMRSETVGGGPKLSVNDEQYPISPPH